MKIHRPVWAAGTLLSQQQFQQQARWEAWSNDQIAHLSLVHPWGALALGFDSDALALGTLKATRLRLRMQDGTLIDTDVIDALPPGLELDRVIDNDLDSATVVLALPHEQANGNNCLFGEEAGATPTRYRRVWHRVQDQYGDDTQEMDVLERALTLRIKEHENGEYRACAVARVLRDGKGGWTLDPDFVPPLLRFDAHPELPRKLSNLLLQLSTKREQLMKMRRESNERMADFAVADVSLFWLLNALNTYQPVLMDVHKHAARHPEQVYLELSRLAGSLMTFSLEHDIDKIPAYDHEQLESVFPPLLTLIKALLDASLPSRVVALELENKGANRWQASFNDPRLCEPDGADFYLSVRSRDSAAQLQAQFPRLCKVGTPDALNHLVNSAVEGVELQPLSHVPAAIPLRLENQYFALDFSKPPGQAVLAAGVCAFYVPGTLAEVKLELFAVLRS